jgi:hypothetical protein
VQKIAEARGISMAQVGLAWVLSREAVSAALIGTTSLSNLKDIIGTSREYSLSQLILNVVSAGVHVQLTDEEINIIEEPYKPQPIIGPR